MWLNARAHTTPSPCVAVRVEGDLLGRDLGLAVGRDRAQRGRLPYRQLVLVDRAVLLGAADHQHTTHPGAYTRVDDGPGTAHVDPRERVAGAPGLADVTARRQVIDRVGLLGRNARHHRVVVGHVERERAVEIQLDHVVAAGGEVRGEVTADETSGAADGCSHAAASW